MPGHTKFFLYNLDGFYSVLLPNCRGQDFTTKLNISGKSGHPCLVPELRGKALNLSPSSIILAMGLLYMSFINAYFTVYLSLY